MSSKQDLKNTELHDEFEVVSLIDEINKVNEKNLTKNENENENLNNNKLKSKSKIIKKLKYILKKCQEGGLSVIESFAPLACSYYSHPYTYSYNPQIYLL